MIRALFLEHPDSIGESYGEHFAKALGFGLALLRAAVACVLHALVPAMHKDTASRAVLSLAGELSARRRIALEAPRGGPEAASFTAAYL